MICVNVASHLTHQSSSMWKYCFQWHVVRLSVGRDLRGTEFMFLLVCLLLIFRYFGSLNFQLYWLP